MRNKIYCWLLMLPGLLFSSAIFAQDNGSSESVMRSSGKIYVVVAICVTILVGLFLYVVSIDRKIGKIEKDNL
jgi:tetrahydromethanopterin S-methyltransferase subunit D